MFLEQIQGQNRLFSVLFIHPGLDTSKWLASLNSTIAQVYRG